MTEPLDVPNDAHLVQLVRGRLGRNLGREARMSGAARPNVSSCGRVVTLHGVAPDPALRRLVEEETRRVPGVLDVVNKLAVSSCSKG